MKTKLLFTIVLLASLTACRKNTPNRVSGQVTDDNHNYFPIKNGREWNYEVKIIDYQKGTTETIQERARYSSDSQCINFYRYGSLWSMAYWYNDFDQIGCCGHMVLADYSQLGCTSDSVLINLAKEPDMDIWVYQFCGENFAAGVTGYDKIRCIRVVQRNFFKVGGRLEIIRYFGYGVGLVLQKENLYDGLGTIRKEETMTLLSHNF